MAGEIFPDVDAGPRNPYLLSRSEGGLTIVQDARGRHLWVEGRATGPYTPPSFSPHVEDLRVLLPEGPESTRFSMLDQEIAMADRGYGPLTGGGITVAEPATQRATNVLSLPTISRPRTSATTPEYQFTSAFDEEMASIGQWRQADGGALFVPDSAGAQASRQMVQLPSGVSVPRSALAGLPVVEAAAAAGVRAAAYPGTTTGVDPQPAQQPVSEPGIRPGIQTGIETASAPASDPAASPGTDPATDPAADPATSPYIDPAADPAAHPAAAPSTVADPTVFPTPAEIAAPAPVPDPTPLESPAPSPLPSPAETPGPRDVARTTIDPVTRTTIDPVTRTNIDPVGRPGADPVTRTAYPPVPQPGQAPVPDPADTSLPDPGGVPPPGLPGLPPPGLPPDDTPPPPEKEFPKGPGLPDDDDPRQEREPEAVPRPSPDHFPRGIEHTEQVEFSYDPDTDDFRATLVKASEPVVTTWDRSPPDKAERAVGSWDVTATDAGVDVSRSERTYELPPDVRERMEALARENGGVPVPVTVQVEHDLDTDTTRAVAVARQPGGSRNGTGAVETKEPKPGRYAALARNGRSDSAQGGEPDTLTGRYQALANLMKQQAEPQRGGGRRRASSRRDDRLKESGYKLPTIEIQQEAMGVGRRKGRL